jgi:hypothetical protein
MSRHQGVIGIVAGRLKEQFGRPAIVEEVADARVAVALQILAHNAAGEQQLIDQRIHAEARLGRATPAPRLPGDRPFDREARPAHPSSRT